MAANYEDFYADFSAALATGAKPKYPEGQNLSKTVPASANKHMLANAALALSTPSAAPQVLDWLGWRAYRPLHENEQTTPSESYRPAIDYPTLALAGYAGDQGRADLQNVLLDTCRASICDLFLSLGCAQPRVVQDEGTPGERCVLVGDGNFTPLKGSQMPAVLGMGKRGYVRADTPQGNLGPWHYLYQRVQTVMLAQVLNKPYAAGPWTYPNGHAHDDFHHILRRWPQMRRWGFSAADLQVAVAYFANPADVGLAQQIHNWAALHPSDESRMRIRGTDRAVESLALYMGSSSTGGLAINAQRADGVTFRTSADTGTRFKNDIREQQSEIAGDRLRCWWVKDPGVEMSIARVVSQEAWRSIISPTGSTFMPGGNPMPRPPQPGPGPSPEPPTLGAGHLTYLGPAGPGESLYGSKNPKTIVRQIHGEGEWVGRWIAEEKA